MKSYHILTLTIHPRSEDYCLVGTLDRTMEISKVTGRSNGPRVNRALKRVNEPSSVKLVQTQL